MPQGEGLGLRRVKGRVAEEWLLEMTRELTSEDLAAAELIEERAVPVPPLRRLSERHHAIARMIAAGKKKMEISVAVGIVPSSISILQNDPTFKELVEHYRNQVHEEFLDAQAEMAGLNKDVILELRSRLEEMPDKFSIGQLTNLMTVTADRTGNGPSSKSEVNVTVGLADRLAEARRRVRERMQQSQIIDISPEKDAAE